MTETTNRYQVMPPLTDEEYQALKEDIAENGVMVPVVQDTEGNIIDGHHRVRAYQELVAEGRAAGGYPIVERSGLTSDGKRDLAWRLNMQRRHLNQAQKHAAIERKLKESPEWADNRIAKLLGVDGKTVRFARVQLEGREEIAKLNKLIGADGKEYPRQLENKFRDAGMRPKAAAQFARWTTQTAPPPEEPTGAERADAGGEKSLAQMYIDRANEAGEAIPVAIVRVRSAEYTVRLSDGKTEPYGRVALLELEGWKKCSCCSGTGIVKE